MNIYDNIRALVKYGLDTGLVEKEDEIFTTNRLLELFKLDEMEETERAYCRRMILPTGICLIRRS